MPLFGPVWRSHLQWQRDNNLISDLDYVKKRKRFIRNDRIWSGILFTLLVCFILSMLYLR